MTVFMAVVAIAEVSLSHPSLAWFFFTTIAAALFAALTIYGFWKVIVTSLRGANLNR